VLLADDDKQLWVPLSEAVKRPVISERRADEHNIIELAAKRVTELVHKELCLSWVSRPHDECIEWNIAGIHLHSNFTFLILHRLQLSVHYVELGVGEKEYMAVHVAQAFGIPLNFQLDSATAVHCLICHGVQTYWLWL